MAFDTQIIIPLSTEMKEALATAASAQNKFTTTFCREILAKSIDYNLEAEPKPSRQRKFASKEERLAFYREKAREQRRLARELLMQYQRQLAQEEVRKARKSLSKGD